MTKYTVYLNLQFVSCNCYPVDSPAVAFVEGQLSMQNVEGCKASGSRTMLSELSAVYHKQGTLVLKVVYLRYFS